MKVNKKIELKILGAESDYPLEYADIVNMPKNEFEAKRNKYYAKDRDRLSSQNVINYLREESEFKTIIFYGNPHLIRQKVDKLKFVKREEVEPIEDYFMAYYLDDFWGRDKICIFYSKWKFNSFVDNLFEYQSNEFLPDFYLNYTLVPSSPCPIFFIKSKMIMKILIELLNNYSLHKSNTDYYYELRISKYLYYYFKRSYLNSNIIDSQAIDSIAFYIKEYNNEEIWSQKVIKIAQKLSTKFDAIKNVDAIDNWMFNFDLPDSLSYISSLRRLAFNFPIDTIYTNPPEYIYDADNDTSTDKFSWINSLKNNNSLLEYYLVNLLWLGTLDEKKQAMSHLQNHTNRNYQTVEEWDNWFFSKYNLNKNVDRMGG